MYIVEISSLAVLLIAIIYFMPDVLKRIILNSSVFHDRPTWKVLALQFLNPDFCDVKEESGSSYFCKCLEQSEAPGVRPVPSDQGKSQTCTAHAVAKCVVSAMDRRGIDVKQDEILKSLQNCIGTTARIWPTSFDEKLLLIEGQKQDNEASTLKAFPIKMNICKVEFNEMKNSQIPNNSFEYVLCTSYISKHDMHSVYIDEKDNATNHLKCINSWGSSNEARVVVLIGDPTNKFYRVKITTFGESESSPRTVSNMNSKEESMEHAGTERCQAEAQVGLPAEAQSNSTDGGNVDRATKIILIAVRKGEMLIDDVRYFLQCLNSDLMGTFVHKTQQTYFQFGENAMREILTDFYQKKATRMSDEEKVKAIVKALQEARLGYLAYKIEEACK